MKRQFEGYLLISDMDGTLLDNEGKISEENINAINRFIAKGGIFTIATGRMMESVRRYLDGIRVQAPIILYNGTKIHDFEKDETIFEMFLENEVKKIIKELKKHDSSLGIEIYCEENVYIFNSCRFTDRFSKKGYEVFYELPDELWEKSWTKILIIGEENQMDSLEEIFEDNFGKINLIRTGENYLEIIPENTSKGHALEKLCEMLNINIEKVIAVGDNMNDFEMLDKAGYGFGVANGNKKLLDSIKYKCSSNDNHAIEDIMKRIEDKILN